ncbi:hypothetical protein JTE90_020687 [Oedothorax gibbosus]|uniref:Uncharacterized protein n=1 Tax=Oedothorax gibbosus TaxID=931172 RepID=A0AAV6V689_9ARAC|nr:hypothetical protein JTE90_020687 [Oedothorax gibbosus]
MGLILKRHRLQETERKTKLLAYSQDGAIDAAYSVTYGDVNKQQKFLPFPLETRLMLTEECARQKLKWSRLFGGLLRESSSIIPEEMFQKLSVEVMPTTNRKSSGEESF